MLQTEEVRTEMKKPNRCCTFCGSNEVLGTPVGMLAAMLDDPHLSLCKTCSRSMQDRLPGEWFLYLRNNDQEHWKKIVTYQALETGIIPDIIRNIRVKQ